MLLHQVSPSFRLHVVKALPTSPRRRVVSLSLTQRGERIVSRTKAETGITQVALMARLLEWYAAQDPRIRTMILSPYAEVRRGLARLVLEEMQADPHKDFDAQPHFDALIDHDFETQSAEPHTPIREHHAPPKPTRRKARG
jgi:hypothetical protein